MDLKYSEELPWPNINSYLLKTGRIREPKEFIEKSIENIHELVPFEQARFFFLNVNGKIQDVGQLGTSRDWTDAYMNYYSKIEDGKYSLVKNNKYDFSMYQNLSVGIKDWTNQSEDEFLKDYIKPQGILYSAGFNFHASDGYVKCIFVLNRVSRIRFTKKEVDVMKAVFPHLENLFKNMHVNLTSENEKKAEKLRGLLSKREIEISEYICGGFPPTQISERLFISVSTIYRHIANIHLKLNVSTRQELVLKLLRYGLSSGI